MGLLKIVGSKRNQITTRNYNSSPMTTSKDKFTKKNNNSKQNQWEKQKLYLVHEEIHAE